MSEELMLVGSTGRPAFIQSNGGRVYICVRDDNYKEEIKKWKNLLRLAHPDMNREPKRSTTTRLVPAYTRVWNGRTIHMPAKIRVCGGGRVGSSKRFKILNAQYERWKRDEAKWYAQFNLEPPQWGK